MEDYEIDLVSKFKCLAGDCKNTCCRGWQIPVDDETYGRYQVLPGLRGKIYRSYIAGKEPRRIRKPLLTCPFFTFGGLCRHQCRGEELLMPVVCRNFPRRVMDYGKVRETVLELSCPETARIFLENPGRRGFVKAPGPQLSVYQFFNDDEVFFSFLNEERDKILDYWWDCDAPLWEKWETLYAYVYGMHEYISRDMLDSAMACKITEDKAAQGKYALYSGRGLAFYPIKTIDRMIVECIDYGALFIRVPRFYGLIKRYLKLFSKINLHKVDGFFHESVLKMCEENPGYMEKYRSYFSYLIQQEWLMAYESYSLIREFCLCVLYTELLMLFDLVNQNVSKVHVPGDTKNVSKVYVPGDTENVSKVHVPGDTVLYLLEHNVRHNPNLTKNLYTIIREEML